MDNSIIRKMSTFKLSQLNAILKNTLSGEYEKARKDYCGEFALIYLNTCHDCPFHNNFFPCDFNSSYSPKRRLTYIKLLTKRVEKELEDRKTIGGIA